MAKIYSTISDTDNKRLNKELKNFFLFWLGNDELVRYRRIHKLCRFISLDYRFYTYKFQLENILCSDEKKERLVKSLDRITSEYSQLCKEFGICMRRKVREFNYLLDKYGLKKNRQLLDFAFWLNLD